MLSLTDIIIIIPVILIVLTIHEYSHALSADMLGDPTPRLAGRLTLNPIPHIDPIGLIMLVLVRIGWAKPVPINPNNFKEPRTGSAIVSVAGPASNFLSAWILASLIRFLPFNVIGLNAVIDTFVVNFIWISIALGVFNLIPVPPLDGYHILELFITPESSDILEQYGFMILIAILLFPGTSYVLMSIIQFIFRLFLPI